MTQFQTALSRPLGGNRGTVAILIRAWRRRLAHAREVARVARELESFDDCGLADLGISRVDIPAVAAGRLSR